MSEGRERSRPSFLASATIAAPARLDDDATPWDCSVSGRRRPARATSPTPRKLRPPFPHRASRDRGAEAGLARAHARQAEPRRLVAHLRPREPAARRQDRRRRARRTRDAPDRGRRRHRDHREDPRLAARPRRSARNSATSTRCSPRCARRCSRSCGPVRATAGHRRGAQAVRDPRRRRQRLRQDDDHRQARAPLHRRRPQGACSPPATRSAPPRSSSCRSGASATACP